jgi:hypothetical protein
LESKNNLSFIKAHVKLEGVAVIAVAVLLGIVIWSLNKNSEGNGLGKVSPSNPSIALVTKPVKFNGTQYIAPCALIDTTTISRLTSKPFIDAYYIAEDYFDRSIPNDKYQLRNDELTTNCTFTPHQSISSDRRIKVDVTQYVNYKNYRSAVEGEARRGDEITEQLTKEFTNNQTGNAALAAKYTETAKAVSSSYSKRINGESSELPKSGILIADTQVNGEITLVVFSSNTLVKLTLTTHDDVGELKDYSQAEQAKMFSDASTLAESAKTKLTSRTQDLQVPSPVVPVSLSKSAEATEPCQVLNDDVFTALTGMQTNGKVLRDGYAVTADGNVASYYANCERTFDMARVKPGYQQSEAESILGEKGYIQAQLSAQRMESSDLAQQRAKKSEGQLTKSSADVTYISKNVAYFTKGNQLFVIRVYSYSASSGASSINDFVPIGYDSNKFLPAINAIVDTLKK